MRAIVTGDVKNRKRYLMNHTPEAGLTGLLKLLFNTCSVIHVVFKGVAPIW